MNIRLYLNYMRGDSNLVISAPHGGHFKPANIPHRKYGTFVMDTYTDELARAMLRYFSIRPSYIIAKIHRDRVDLNRAFAEATQDNIKAELIWDAWHRTLNNYCRSKSLYIDIHSHNNSDEFQLGFNLSKEDFIALENKPEDPNYDRVYGEFSVKKGLENLGYKVYEPKHGEVYFNGGYDIERHGQNNCNAFQIEVPVVVVKDNIEKVAKDLVESIQRYYFARYS
jgi:N-formylglutamate amidohydrolase